MYIPWCLTNAIYGRPGTRGVASTSTPVHCTPVARASKISCSEGPDSTRYSRVQLYQVRRPTIRQLLVFSAPFVTCCYLAFLRAGYTVVRTNAVDCSRLVAVSRPQANPSSRQSSSELEQSRLQQRCRKVKIHRHGQMSL
jgi:hypothetical protein